MEPPPELFDRRLWRARRSRARFDDPLHDLVCEGLVDRLGDFRREFPRAVVAGTLGGRLAESLAGRFGTELVVQADASEAVARAARSRAPGAPAAAADEESLPFADESCDLAISGLTLHWTNDPLATLAQLRRCLAPDGLLLGATLGGGTLAELRECLLAAESETKGGAAPRIAPMAGLTDCGDLLARAGFALPVADIERLCIEHPDPVVLMRALRRMGEGNAMKDRGGGLTRATLALACELYFERHRSGEGVRATFEVVYLSGRAPHPDHPKPLRPGSAASRLADALGTEETRLAR